MVQPLSSAWVVPEALLAIHALTAAVNSMALCLRSWALLRTPSQSATSELKSILGFFAFDIINVGGAAAIAGTWLGAVHYSVLISSALMI